MPPVEQKIIERTVEKRGGFGAALIGGALAAILGFVAGKSQIIDPLLPPSWRSADNSEAVASLEARLSEQGQSLSDLRDEVAAIEMPDVSGLSGRLEELSGEITPLAERLDGLEPVVGSVSAALGEFESRLTEIEKRPISEGLSDQAIAAYEAELDKLRQSITSQRADVEQMFEEARALEAEAAANAQLAANQSAVARLRGRLDTGASYEDILAELQEGGVEVPDVLSATAADGIVTLDALRSGFPDAARNALAAVRAESKGAGLLAFLERQTGARSVAPKEGSDPDAILSRAEAALDNGDLDTTLSELSALPETAQTALSDWLSVARNRQSALDAVDTLAQSLNSN
ncbi:COG4223 family protein [Cribrihabitans marinus]|uniref:COG4223 family protein n=1 Tax=Cribrihabitans marinus TaxID=1227549 RepID=UPI0016683121|nr:mitofilin family membrane protein [Cribrihabitans marinus]GGH29404.1 hypothetical protein GCM10010973_18880 [Cribrihabitans marinus]